MVGVDEGSALFEAVEAAGDGLLGVILVAVLLDLLPGELGWRDLPREHIAEEGILVGDEGRLEGGLRLRVVGEWFAHCVVCMCTCRRQSMEVYCTWEQSIYTIYMAGRGSLDVEIRSDVLVGPARILTHGTTWNAEYRRLAGTYTSQA